MNSNGFCSCSVVLTKAENEKTVQRDLSIWQRSPASCAASYTASRSLDPCLQKKCANAIYAFLQNVERQPACL